MSVVDFHCHVFPDSIQRFVPNRLRKTAKMWLRPFAGSIHQAQTYTRWIPELARRPIDQLSALIPATGLLIESSLEDLNQSIKYAQVDRAVLIAHPPMVSNEFILDICKSDPRFIPAVNLPPLTPHAAEKLRSYIKEGAKILKIHAASDGEGAESPHYRTLLEIAAEHHLPVILHTGCLHSHLFYRKPELGNPREFESWYQDYPSIKFILAHMNFHQPDTALDLGEKFGNIYVDTSWQPSEVIAEAVRRLGSEHVLMGSDWPFLGQNHSVMLDRIQDCVDAQMFSQEDAEYVLGKSAEKILNV